MFIKNKPRGYYENNPKHNWNSLEATSATEDYSRQQHITFHQTTKYNYRQQYHKNRTSQNYSSFNTYV